MQLMSSQNLFLLSLIVGVALIYLLAPILTPFMLGAILAYLANPAVKWLVRRGLPHLLSVIAIFTLVFGLLIVFLLMLVPLIQQQVVLLIEEAPRIYNWIQNQVLPWLQQVVNVDTMTNALSTGLPKAGQLFSAMLHSGAGFVDVMVNVVLTPVVTFYLLRDWDGIISRIQCLLPRAAAPVIIMLAKQCDEVLGAFFRGQLLIMLALCLIYSIGLAVIGLQLGIIIGLIGGLLSIVPYLGSIFVVLAATIASLVQFGTWQQVVAVLVVYCIGQIIEGYVLTPYLIGNRIGLHPVAVIFSIMAGGALFGFFGVLLALPVAAIIMVFVRYLVEQYQLRDNSI